MPNIFSGLFNQSSGSDAAGLAKYKQELEEYGYDLDSFRQDAAVDAIMPELEDAIKYMTPERQSHIRMQLQMMHQNPLFAKGSEGFNSSFKQRGTTIADMLKQEKHTEEANKRQMYKVKHPTAESTNKKLEVARQYMEWTPEKRSLARDAWRDRQLVDTKTGFQNVYDKQFIAKNLIQAKVDETIAPIITERLVNFYDDVDQAEDFLVVFENNRKDIQKLYGITPDNTGWNAVFNMIPAGDAHAWMNLRDTVVANIGLNKILELKASSAQGATGLGALNEAELKMLQDHLGSLAQTQDPVIIQERLRLLDGDMQRIVNRKLRKLRHNRAWYNRNKTYQGIKAGSPDLILPEQEYLFSKEGYNKPLNESQLGIEQGTGEMTDEQLKESLGL